MFDNKIKVYVKLDKNNCIVDINSSIFIKDTKDYILIDEGSGDKYAHAQGNYLDKGLIDMQGRYNYKYIDNKIVELTEDEKPVIVNDNINNSESVSNESLKQRLSDVEIALSELMGEGGEE